MSLETFSTDAGFDRALLDAAVHDFNLTPFGTALLKNRWRRGDGLTANTGVITLGVCFLNGDDGQKELVRRAASNWLTGDLGRFLQFKFDVPRNQAQLTVDVLSDRNNSIVGRDSASFAQSRPTIRLFNMLDYIVMHEFGHAIGLDHEHQNPNVSISWNKSAVIADMAKQNWTPEMCEQNIFAHYGTDYACVGDPGFNSKSVMLYPISSRWTTNGYSTETNTSISDRDRKCINGIYKA